MPIRKDEWDQGRTWETLETRVLKFLRQNRGNGFSETVVFHALETLVKEGSVKAR